MAEEEYKTEAVQALEKWCNERPVTLTWKDLDDGTETYYWSEVRVVSEEDPSFLAFEDWSAKYSTHKSIIHQRNDAAKNALKKISEIEKRVKEHKRTLALTKLLEPPKKKAKDE